jgi:hypothetical protein
LDISQTDLEKLRAQIRDVVVAVLRRREQAGSLSPSGSALPKATGRSLIVLFTGDQLPADEFFANVATLAGQGYAVIAALSHSFQQVHRSAVMAKLPKGATELTGDESAENHWSRTAEALVAPHLSSNTVAKLALGIQDSLPSRLLREMLAIGKPVCVATDLVGHRELQQNRAPGAPPALVRIGEDHLHTVQQMGVRFAAGNIASCLTEILRPEINETPERLAKSKPTAKREFVTAEDVWTAMSKGHKDFLYPRNAIVTDQAREYAQSRGITLREQ